MASRLHTSTGVSRVQVAGDRDGRQVDPEDGRDGLCAMSIAQQFGLKIVEPRPALVPFTFHEAKLGAGGGAGGRFG